MKRTIILLAMSLFITSISFATDFQATNPGVSLDGNTVTMKADLTGTVLAPQVKVLYLGMNVPLTENAVLQPYYDYYSGSDQNKTSLSEMYAQGYKLIQYTIADTRTVVIGTTSYTNNSFVAIFVK